MKFLMKRIKQTGQTVYGKVNLMLLFILFPNFVFASSTNSDFNTISKPLQILGKLIVMVIGLAYLVIAGMWIWLPILVILLIKKHYDKKFDERGEENSKDMLTKMIIGGLGAAIMSFVVVGVFGMIFFNKSSLMSGIQGYYGGMIASIVAFIKTNMGLSAAK